MSNGIVMEKHRKYSIVMTTDGGFYKVKPAKGVSLGTEVSYEVSVSKASGLLFFRSHRSVTYIAIACLVLLFTMPFYLLTEQSKTYAYVHLDINPSLEIGVDKELYAVTISPLNDNAEKLIKHLQNYKDVEIEQVIEEIMNKSDTLELTK